jgi:hypothetical protein
VNKPSSNSRSALHECKVIRFPTISDRRGDLTFIEAQRHLPFAIKRVYYVYGATVPTERGGHAHRRLSELLIAVSGTFDIILDDGHVKRRVRLSQASSGLLVVPMIWRTIANFRPGAICLVLSSDYYAESDYLRRYWQFISLLNSKPPH